MSDSVAPVRAALAGQYEIEREIGAGAFATVYLARDLKHDRPVAFKVLKADQSSKDSELRFLREIHLLAKLQHPHILPLIDSGHTAQLLYYVMPYVQGESLRQRISREHQLGIDAAVAITVEAADALACAHDHGIIHRDVKPENILLSGGHPIVADFGIARAIDVAGVKQLTRTGFGSPGTPAYMSPEQLMTGSEVDARSDIYSLGCVLFEMLTGTLPFAGKDAFVRRLTEPPPRACTRRKDVPTALDDVISKALATEPSERYASAREFSAALTASKAARENTVAANGQQAAYLSADDEARDSFLIARRIVQRRVPSEYAAAQRELTNALKRDPRFARAHALEGVLWMLRADYDVAIDDAISNGKRAAENAISLDQTLTDAHAVLGLCATLAWDWDVAAALLEKAVSDGTDSLAYHWYALYLCARGKTDAAQELLTQAIAFDPRNPQLYGARGVAAFYHGAGDAALISLERACSLDPTNALWPAFVGMAHSLIGEFEKAASRYAQAIELAGRLEPMVLAARIWTLSRAGRREEAEREAANFLALSETTDVSPFLIGAVAACLDRRDAAISALRRAYLERDGWLLSLRVHPWLKSLRELEEFQNISAAIGV